MLVYVCAIICIHGACNKAPLCKSNNERHEAKGVVNLADFSRLGGDFRQCGPVLRNSKGAGRRAAEVNASLSHWERWKDVYVLRLHLNMRVQNCATPDRKERLERWSQWLTRLGDGKVPLDEHGRLEVPASIAFMSIVC